MAIYTQTLRIAELIIRMKSSFPLEKLTGQEKKLRREQRFINFFHSGHNKPDILIKIEIVDKLPKLPYCEPSFVVKHFQDKKENWRLYNQGNGYIFSSPVEDKMQVMVINKTFNRVTAYLLPKDGKGKVWNYIEILYDFLLILLIQRLALKKRGIVVHSVGIKDLDGKGLLFAGKSGCGKSTTARIWHRDPRAMVLNDDRIIVRKKAGRFFIHGSPWHGSFSDYLTSRIESAPLEKLFFIYHAPKNEVRRIPPKEAFNLFYPAIFPTFWDKHCLEQIVSFCQELIEDVPCYSLGFKNNEQMVDFVRAIK